MYFVSTCVCHIDNRFKSKREIDHFFSLVRIRIQITGGDEKLIKKYWVVFEEQTVYHGLE